MEKLQLSNVHSYVFLFITIILIFGQINEISSSECGEHEFKCHSDGKCIKTENVCNRKKDCADNSDEEDCDLCLAPNWHQCTGGQVCISAGFLCDGQEHCPDGDDEDNCDGQEHIHEKCGKYEYTCTDKACIPLDMVCDGQKQCADGSDETVGCLHAEEQCKGYFCHNKRCLESHTWVCDGFDDCGDESDEQNCAWNCKPELDKFLCKDNDTCIPLVHACDNITQCADKSDENGLCLDLKFNCQTNPCPEPSKCHQLPLTGPTCICPKGYKFDMVNKKCEDINECENYGICSQKCTNTNGSYECSCMDKYLLKNDGHTCAVQGGEPLLLYTTQRSVVGIYLQSRHMYKIADNLSQVIGVAYDGEHIYWTNIQHQMESLVRSKADGSEQEILLTSGIEAPEDLAIDWLTGNIYFSDNVLKHISVCSKHGHHCKILITLNIDQPRGIALYPEKGIMFWSDWGQTPMIGKAFMDGSNFLALVKSDIYWPNCIAIDQPNDRLYWVDAKLTKIESIRLDGSDRKIILNDILKHPYGLSVFEDNVYWSDWETKSLHTCNKFTGKKHEVIAKDKRIYAVHVYHSALQSKIINPCDNMSCSHLCLLAGNGSNCACPEDMILGVEERVCIKIVKKQKLYIGMGSYLLQMEHSTFGRHQISQAHSLNIFIHNMEYNSINGTIFIADNIRKIIYEFNPVTKNLNKLVKKNIGNVTAMSFDNLAQNLYWTDSERHTIEVLSLRKNYRAIVHFFLGVEKPISLVVIPEKGKMFVALQATNHTHIDTLSLHGRGPQHYTFGTQLGNGGIQLILDEPEKDIFWLDRENEKLEYANYDTYTRSLFRTNLNKPYSITLVDDDILWSSRKRQSIYWTNSKHNFGTIKQFEIENPQVNIHSTTLDEIPLLSSKPILVNINHRCLQNNGDCSHICVSVGKFSSACICPTGMVFKDNKNKTCIESWDCEFRCESGECLTASRKCNGHKDCADGSDEKDCDSKDLDKMKKKICRFDQFACHDGTECIINSLRCDKEFDCHDKSDEDGCEDIDHLTKCRNNQFRCNNGRCVDLTTVCDEFDDCGDKSDERNCQNSKYKNVKKCSKNMFQCTSGQCISKDWECDGYIDCIDGSDEHDNCVSKSCQKGMVQCRLGQCIDSKLICDGHNDCGDNSDELNCESEKRQIVCGDELDSFGDPKKFQCTSDLTLCLDISAKCNKTAECPRGEDEIGCGGCSIYEFECDNKECIRKEFRCDKEKDCTDGSDEIDCDHYNSTVHQNLSTNTACHDGMFDCKDSTCIDYSRVCDGHNDCALGEDETALCKTACKSNPCQQKCTPSPYGAICSCSDGYRLNGDKKTCTDINECIEQQPCSQICENSVGSYRCSCHSGFLLRTDKSSCKSIEREHYLLFTSFDQARTLSENPISLKVMWTANDSKITGMDVNVKEKRAFFTIQDSNNIYEYNLEKSGFQYLEDPGHKTKLVVDWVTNNIYVVVKNTVDSLKVCNFTKRTCARIVKFRLKDSIKSLAIDPINKLLFFSVTFTSTFGMPKTTIYKSGLDGSKPIPLVTGEMYVTALEADSYKRELYFMEAHSKTLQSIKYNDQKVKPNILIKKNNAIKNPSGLSIFENVAYITNTGSPEAVKCQLYGDRICNGFNINVYNIEDIVVVAPSRQPKSDNTCDNNKCDVICIQAKLGSKCICYDGKYVAPGVKCKNTILTDDNNQTIEMAQTSDNDDNDDSDDSDNNVTATGSSNTTIFAVCFTIMGIILLGLCGYIFYRRRTGHGNFLINMHFQNPLVRSDDQYGATPSVTAHFRKPEITMDENVSNSKLPIFRPIQKFFKSSKATQITMETTERNGNTTFSVSNNNTKNSGIGILEEYQQECNGDVGNFDDDPRAPLVL